MMRSVVVSMSKFLLGVRMHLPPQPTLLILIRSYEPRILINRWTESTVNQS
jgi:hypothetical protein